MTLSNPPGGFGKDLRRLKSEGTATTAELRDFLSQLRGKSTQEVLGVVAQSELTRSLSIAAIGTLVLLVVFTVGPYLLRGETAAAAPAAPAAVEQDAGQTGDAEVESPAAERAAPQTDLLEKLEMNETREAPADENPLDNKLDNLLDGLE